MRPTPGRPELLRETLETLAAALRECATNQAAFDRDTPLLHPVTISHPVTFPHYTPYHTPDHTR